MKGANQFRPGPPPEALERPYARDYNEVKEFAVKSVKPATRSPTRCASGARQSLRRVYRPPRSSARKQLGLAENAAPAAAALQGIANCYISTGTPNFTYQSGGRSRRSATADQDGNRRHRARRRLGAAQRDADASGVPSQPASMGVPRDAFSNPSSEPGPRASPSLTRRRTLAAAPFDSRRSGGRAQGSARRGGIHFRNSLEHGRRDGTQARD